MTAMEIIQRVQRNKINRTRAVRARRSIVTMQEAREKNQDQTEIVVSQLARVLDIQTDMGKEFLKQMLLNAALFDKKQRDYGSGNYAMFGQRGAIMRCHDKLMRLKRIVFDDPAATPANETVEDSWDDLANIAVIGRLCADGKWK